MVLVVAAGFVAGAAGIVGSAAASHREASAFLHHATGVTWSLDGKQIGFTYEPFADAECGCGKHVRSWIVRRSSRAGGPTRTVRAQKGLAAGSMWWAAGGRILFNSGPFLYSVGVQGGKPKRLVAPDCKEYYGCQISGCVTGTERRPTSAVVARREMGRLRRGQLHRLHLHPDARRRADDGRRHTTRVGGLQPSCLRLLPVPGLLLVSRLEAARLRLHQRLANKRDLPLHDRAIRANGHELTRIG